MLIVWEFKVCHADRKKNLFDSKRDKNWQIYHLTPRNVSCCCRMMGEQNLLCGWDRNIWQMWDMNFVWTSMNELSEWKHNLNMKCWIIDLAAQQQEKHSVFLPLLSWARASILVVEPPHSQPPTGLTLHTHKQREREREREKEREREREREKERERENRERLNEREREQREIEWERER